MACFILLMVGDDECTLFCRKKFVQDTELYVANLNIHKISSPTSFYIGISVGGDTNR
ncbi:MAG: hypothetical protein GXC73_17645 [Chitinophagaceae bacterium]|nr:hypothetical protein [Chitinophagaceae bacterium]